MDDDLPSEKSDLTLAYLRKQDLYEMSVGDLQARIDALKAEIARSETAIGSRDASRSEADKLFNL